MTNVETARPNKADRIFHLNDVEGGPSSIFERSDPQAQITTHIRSGHSQIVRLFDIFGREAIIPYIVEEVARLHRESRVRKQLRGSDTLLVLNAAARDLPENGHEQNGHDFYTGRVGENVRVVGPVQSFSRVKSITSDLRRVLNESGIIFDIGDQFRSASIENADTTDSFFDVSSSIPADAAEIPEPTRGTRGIYVDRFGNISVETNDDHDLEQDLIHEAKNESNGYSTIGLQIANTKLDLTLAINLASVQPGDYAIYRNWQRGGRFNIVWNWTPGASRKEKTEKSPYALAGEPEEGFSISIR